MENCIWNTGHLWSRMYLFRRNVIIWFQASLLASLHKKIYIPQLLSTLPIVLRDALMYVFWLSKKDLVLRNLGSKDSANHVFNFFSVISLIFYEIISIFWIWHTFPSPEICFWSGFDNWCMSTYVHTPAFIGVCIILDIHTR